MCSITDRASILSDHLYYFETLQENCPQRYTKNIDRINGVNLYSMVNLCW